MGQIDSIYSSQKAQLIRQLKGCGFSEARANRFIPASQVALRHTLGTITPGVLRNRPLTDLVAIVSAHIDRDNIATRAHLSCGFTDLGLAVVLPEVMLELFPESDTLH